MLAVGRSPLDPPAVSLRFGGPGSSTYCRSTVHTFPLSSHVPASPQLEGAPLLVLAHKHDTPSAADAGAVGAALGLGAVASDSDESSQSRRFVVLETSCTDAQGLFAALDWALGAHAR